MLTIILGILVGLGLGLTGGGGSLFALPLLIYVLAVEPLMAITVSLAAVTAMASMGAIEALLNKMVEWRVAVILAVGGMVTAPFGVALSRQVDEVLILTSFAILMLLIAASMWYRVIKQPDDAAVLRVNFDKTQDESGAICRLDNNQRIRLTAPCSIVLLVCGGVTGILSGFFGVGGGFLIVPALTFVTQLNIHRAVASSLLIIALIGLSGVASALLQGRQIELVVTGLFVIGGLIGLFAGRLMSRRAPAILLQKIFATSMVIIALATLFLNY